MKQPYPLHNPANWCNELTFEVVFFVFVFPLVVPQRSPLVHWRDNDAITRTKRTACLSVVCVLSIANFSASLHECVCVRVCVCEGGCVCVCVFVRRLNSTVRWVESGA